jgi:glycosyltransferase involved in cell wall biosynthesis
LSLPLYRVAVSPHAAAVPAPAVSSPAPARAATPSHRPRDLFLVANNIEELGGLQRVAHLLAGAFAQRGHRVRLIGVQRFSPAHTYPTPATPYETHLIGDSPTSGRRGRVGGRGPGLARPAPQDIEHLNRILGSVEHGILICLQIHAMGWVAAAETSHLRIIGASHESFMASVGSGRGTRMPSRYRRITQRYGDIDAFLLLTHQDADQFRRVGFNNTGVMPNPVTLHPTRAASLDAPTIITVGRLAREKNYQALIEAFAHLAPQHPEWSVKIFGDGPMRDVLQQQIDDSGLADRVKLMGMTNDVESQLLDSSIFALSSESEGLPLVLVEAMVCGVPCVAYDCSPGIREIITDGVDGLVVTNRSVTELTAGLGRLIDDADLRRSMGRAALSSAQRFSEDTVLERWEELFDTVER